MATTVTITGSGIPMLAPGRAGPGALIRHGDTALQIDCGRATALRLVEAGVRPLDLDALLLTHHHSDHLVGLTDILLARWVSNGPNPYPAFPLHCPAGPAVDYVAHLFDQLGPDLDSRRAVSGYPDDPHPRILAFDAPTETTEIARYGDVVVETTTVDHGELAPAVGYRFNTPDGAVVVSGDTVVCDAVERMAAGADVLVHEAISPECMQHNNLPSWLTEKLLEHHAEASTVGAMAARLDVPALVITHAVPSPRNDDDRAFFVDAVRHGGYEGDLTIADDLFVASVG